MLLCKKCESIRAEHQRTKEESKDDYPAEVFTKLIAEKFFYNIIKEDDPELGYEAFKAFSQVSRMARKEAISDQNHILKTAIQEIFTES